MLFIVFSPLLILTQFIFFTQGRFSSKLQKCWHMDTCNEKTLATGPRAVGTILLGE